jgi:hypothetical protein
MNLAGRRQSGTSESQQSASTSRKDLGNDE